MKDMKTDTGNDAGRAGMNAAPSAERTHIGFFGRRNAGKSSVVNAVTGQDLAVVSDVAGTTTDPVSKAMEILPLGPVVVIDTAGFDDTGELGALRVNKTRMTLNKTDIAVLVVDATEGMKDCDRELIDLFKAKNIPYVVVFNKSDLAAGSADTVAEGEAACAGSPAGDAPVMRVSALTGEGINELREKIASLRPEGDEVRLVGDFISPGDVIVLVIPIDDAAPKGRIILPQQQAIRDILDSGASCIVCRETELEETLGKLADPPQLVITDSQAFGVVSQIVPGDVLLTSFSILMARKKGLLDAAVRGISAVKNLKDGDRVLIAEGCTHHRQCGDIGTVKIPKWLRGFTDADISIETCSGTEFPEDLSPYALVVHCGGCMLTAREVSYRTKCAVDQGIPITNYGTLIAYTHGILERSLGVLPELQKELRD